MQFLWKYVDDMVGKGIELSVLGEMFFYAALYMVPMALPLGLLLASLITFGDLGERLELLAMKSAGISLLRIMRPLIILVIMICIGAFYFQNNILPKSQLKLWTLVLSMKQKSPELDIPEGVFYKEIPGYNLYVRSKDKNHGMMHDMMIYDFSDGFENAKVIVADSGKLKSSIDKQHLVLTLFSGESFENLKSQKTYSVNDKIPYRRETFSLKEILITFDANFSMADESILQGREMAKDIDMLRSSIDSISYEKDSFNVFNISFLKNQSNLQLFQNPDVHYTSTILEQEADTVVIDDFDEFFSQKTPSEKKELFLQAKSRLDNLRNDIYFRSITQSDQQSHMNNHKIELHKKFTLSVACLLFFFIGAPLGAIIRKGGIGMPAVISVFLFLSYYTIDIFGQKMAKQDVWPIWQGMWLSTFILLGLGAFFTYKAVNDSVVMEIETWSNFLRKIVGAKEVRNYQRKEIVIYSPNYDEVLSELATFDEKCESFLLKLKKRPSYLSFWRSDFNKKELKGLKARQEHIVDALLNSEANIIIGKLMDYPILTFYKKNPWGEKYIRAFCIIFIPLGILFYILGYYERTSRIKTFEVISKVNKELEKEIKTNLRKKDNV
ncbi:membrane protein [Bacteroidales bacterium]|nr:membrane protein [Bacteroidales bacterium]